MTHPESISMFANEIIILLIMTSVFLLYPKTRKLIFFDLKNGKNNLVTKRIEFLDFAKGISIIAVIIIHVSWVLLQNDNNSVEKIFLLSANNLGRFAIAVFFICSGILIQGMKKYGRFAIFLKRKFFSIFLPYLLVSLLINFSLSLDWKTGLVNILTGNASTPYYFIIVLCQFYLLSPWLQKIKNEKWFLPITFVISLTSFLLPETWHFMEANLFFKYLFFFCYGLKIQAHILKNSFPLPKIHPLLLVFFCYGILMIIFPSHLYNIRLIYGTVFFHFLYLIFSKNKQNFLIKIFENIGQISLWIFLLHYPLLQFFYFSFRETNLNFFAFYSLCLFGCFFSSLLISWPADLAYKKLSTLLTSSPQKHD